MTCEVSLSISRPSLDGLVWLKHVGGLTVCIIIIIIIIIGGAVLSP
jgi:hypothetical protein